MGLRRSGLGLALALAACGTETPLEIGSDLSPIEVESFEVVLPAESFIAAYHNFSGYVSPREVNYGIVATDFDDAVDVRTIARFVPPPSQVSYFADGASRTDTMPTFPSARLVVVADTLLSGEEDVQLSLYRVAEPWDPATVSWTMRIDSVANSQPWSVPGGALGELISQGSYNPQIQDSLVMAVDSQTIATWADTTDNSRGVILLAESGGARVRINQLVLHLDARPSQRPDTLIEVSSTALVATFMVNEQEPQSSTLQVGGVPAWRSFVEFAPGLDTLTVCGGEPERCQPLSDLRINFASLVLSPTATREGMAPEDTLEVQARGLSVSSVVPLERSPLRERLTPATRQTIALAPERFQQVAGAAPVEIPITTFVSNLTRAVEDPTDQRFVALIAVPEGMVFGHAAFHAEGEHAPRLRLIVSSMKERDAP